MAAGVSEKGRVGGVVEGAAEEEAEVQASMQPTAMPWSVLGAAPTVINHLMLCEMHTVIFEQLPKVSFPSSPTAVSSEMVRQSRV